MIRLLLIRFGAIYEHNQGVMLFGLGRLIARSINGSR